MVLIVLWLVFVTNDVRQHHFYKQKIYLLRISPLIQPLFPLRIDYFNQNNIDIHVEIIHCIQAIWGHWSREPITTLSRPSIFMLEFSGQLTTPDRFSYHTGPVDRYCSIRCPRAVSCPPISFEVACPSSLNFYNPCKNEIKDKRWLGIWQFQHTWIYERYES